VKVRIGLGLGTRTVTHEGERFASLVDGLEHRGFDSLWLSERVGADAPDPVVGMAFAAGRTRKLKFGTSVMVLPGRNPVLVAKALASLDRLSGGRLLPAFGLGVADPHEQQAFTVARGERAAWFDEALPLVRRLWAEDSVDHRGDRFVLEGVSVLPKPIQKPLDVWLGGIAPSELRRAGRLGDGWLPSFCTPAEMPEARRVVEQAAEEAGRVVDPGHFGALVPYSHDTLPDLVGQLLKRRRPGVDPADVVPVGLTGLREQLERFVEAGTTKFVVVPVAEPDLWDAELDALAETVLVLQS
jgi:probable F420-dependent oxidoreductase